MASSPPPPGAPSPAAEVPQFVPVVSNVLLFLLCSGLAATVNLRLLQTRSRHILKGAPACLKRTTSALRRLPSLCGVHSLR